MTRDRIDAWAEKGILAAVIAVLIFGPLATGAVRTLELLVIQSLTVLALGLWLVRFWANPQMRLLWPPIAWAVVAFVIYAIIRYRGSDLEYVSRSELIRVLIYAVLFLVILNNVVRQDSVLLVCQVLVYLGMVISVYAIYQFATHSDRVWHFVKPAGYVHRGSGTFICPNHLAGFLEMILPVGLALTLSSRLKPLSRIFLGYASLVMLAGIAVSVSRGGWVATAVSLFVLFAVLIRRREFRIPALILVVIVAGGIYQFYGQSIFSQQRFKNMMDTGLPDEARMRFWLWGSALDMWRDHPWLGAGPGHFNQLFPGYRPWNIQARPGYAHNDYLNCLADWGVAGMFLVTLALVLLLVGAIKTWRYVRRDDGGLNSRIGSRATIVLGTGTGLVAILVHSAVDFNMQIPANAILAITLMALLSGCLRFAGDRYWLKPGVPGKVLITLLGLAAIGFLVFQGGRRAREYYWFSRARSDGTADSWLSALKRAAAIEPTNFETTYAIGESLRELSWQGEPGFEKLATEAIQWFQRGVQLNPYDAYNPMRIGMCLDWLGRHTEAKPYYVKALNIDQHNYYLQAHLGWHHVQTGEYELARMWFNRSWHLNYTDNPIAWNYLQIVDRKLKEARQPKP